MLIGFLSRVPSGARLAFGGLAGTCLIPWSTASAAPVPVGTGPESAEVTINFSDGAVAEFLVSYATPTTTGEQLLKAIDAARSDFTLTSTGTGGGFPGGFFLQRMDYAGHADGPTYVPPEGYWHYWTADGPAVPWSEAGAGAGERVIDNGYRDGWVFGRATAPVPEPATVGLLGLGAAGLLGRRRRRRRGRVAVTVGAVATAGTAALAAVPASARAAYTYDPNDFAVSVVTSTGLPGTGLYDDPQAILGRPTLKFNNGTSTSPDYHRAKLVEAPFNTGSAGEKLITTMAAGTSVTVRMGRPVTNDARHPFGVDFIVFGNAAYGGSGGGGGFTSDATNLNAFTLNGTLFAEPTKVSVSPDGTAWYTYQNGPYADGTYPTNSYLWNTAAAAWTDTEADPTLPVNPALASTVSNKTAAAVLDTVYAGSAGGTGFDLAESGFSSVQYVRIDGLTDYADGEIDAIAAVRAVPEPAAAGLVAVAAAAGLLRRGR